MTGCVFAHLLSLYARAAAATAAVQQQQPPASAPTGPSRRTRARGDGARGMEVEVQVGGAAAQLAAVEELMGRLRIARSDHPYLALFGEDADPDRSRLLVAPDAKALQRGEAGRAAREAGIGSMRTCMPSSRFARHAYLELPHDHEGGAPAAAQALGDAGLQVLTYQQWKQQRQAAIAAGVTPEQGGQSAKRRRVNATAT